MTTTLTPHQNEVFEAITTDLNINLQTLFKSDSIEDSFISLSGPAGTGKSYLTTQIIKSISKTLKDINIPNDGICITAPTHKAVKVIKDMIDAHGVKASCRTIHSFLNIKPVFDENTGEEKFTVLRTNAKPAKASLLIIDESSMISQDLYAFIIEAFNRGRIKTILFIGDPYQLLPINSNINPVYQLPKQYHLTKIVRQAKESPIIELATKLRDRIESQDFIELSEILKETNECYEIQFLDTKKDLVYDFYKNKNWYEEDKIITAFTNKDVEIFNENIRNQYWKEKQVPNASFLLPQDKIRFKDTITRGSIFNPVVFQNGEEVTINTAELFTDNRNIKYWQCTAVGRKNTQIFRVIDPSSMVTFNQILDDFVNMAKTSPFPHNKTAWRQYYNLKNSFASVQYIYSATIHKLQGSTYDSAYIDLSDLAHSHFISNDMKYRLAYVAITRARKNIKICY